MRNEGVVTQKCKIGVKLSGKLQVRSVTYVASHCLVNGNDRVAFTERVHCLYFLNVF